MGQKYYVLISIITDMFSPCSDEGLSS